MRVGLEQPGQRPGLWMYSDRASDHDKRFLVVSIASFRKRC
jgi:hypothetical protein